MILRVSVTQARLVTSPASAKPKLLKHVQPRSYTSMFFSTTTPYSSVCAVVHSRPSHHCVPHSAVRSDSAMNDGDGSVQDGLVNMIGLQIGQAHVSTYFEDQSDRLRATAEQAKNDVDRLDQLQSDRASLAFGSALADINQSADELEADLREQRAEMEADEAEFSSWQRQMAVDRSRGHFFKSLYPTEDPSHVEGDSHARQSPVMSESRPAPEAAGSQGQLMVFSFLAGVLLMAVAADAASASPSWPQDTLYLCLGVSLAFSAWQQRRSK